MRHHWKTTGSAALLSAFVLLAVAAETRELKPPELRISLPGQLKTEQTVTEEKSPDGQSVLRIENKSPKGFCEFSIPGGMPLDGFDMLNLDVRLDRKRSSPLQNFSVRLKDASGETLQYTLAEKQLPDGDTLRFRIDRNQKPFASWGGNKDGKIDLPARLEGGAFRFQDGNGVLFLRGVSATTVVPYAVAPSVELLKNREGFAFFRPGQGNGVLCLHNSNTFPAEGNFSFRIETSGESEKGVPREIPFSLGANESVKIPFDIPAEFGLYEAVCKVTLKGRTDGPEQTFRFASMIPAVPGETPAPGEFLFGICCQHLPKLSPENMEKEIAAAALCGAEIVRFCSYWDVLEPQPGKWNFVPLDRTFRLMERYGLRSQVLHSRLPNWAVAADWKSIRKEKQGKPGRPLPDADAWRNFVRTYTVRYNGKAMHTEIWNEPDLLGFADFSTEAYLNMLKIAAEETRANDPGTILLSGGFATIPAPGWNGGNAEIAERTMSEGKGDYDVFALHNHSLFPAHVTVLNRFDEMRKRNGDTKRWYMNESGLTTRGSTESEQAATLFRKLLYSWARGAVAFNWYNLRNDGWDKSNGEHNFGLLLNDYQPKQAYIAYNMLASLYAGGKFIRVFEENADYTSLLFRDRNGDWLAANFLNRSDGTPRNLALTGITGNVERFDLFGNAQKLPVHDGTLQFELVGEPHTLKITGEEPEFFGEPVRFLESSGLYRGRDNRITLEVRNPSKRKQEYRIGTETPATLRVRCGAETLRLVPGEAKTVELFLHPAMKHPASETGKLHVTAGTAGTFTLALPSEYIRPLASGNFRKEPDFVLDNRNQVSIQVPSAPEYEGLVWKSPADLSANVFLARNGKELKLRVEVTDDLHVQKFRGESLWQGDSVQFVVAPEGERGFWRFGLSLDPDRKPEVYLWDAPTGKNQEAIIAAARLSVVRNDNARRTVYEAAIPLDLLGIAGQEFRFNLLVNDNDGRMRESFISVAPGLGRNFDVRTYPLYKDEK